MRHYLVQQCQSILQGRGSHCSVRRAPAARPPPPRPLPNPLRVPHSRPLACRASSRRRVFQGRRQAAPERPPSEETCAGGKATNCESDGARPHLRVRGAAALDGAVRSHRICRQLLRRRAAGAVRTGAAKLPPQKEGRCVASWHLRAAGAPGRAPGQRPPRARAAGACGAVSARGLWGAVVRAAALRARARATKRREAFAPSALCAPSRLAAHSESAAAHGR